MLSNDNNIETIAEFIEEFKKWLSLRAEYHKLGLIDKVVRTLKILILAFITFTLVMLILIYLSFAVAYALGDCLGSNVYGFLIMGGVYFLLMIIILANRRSMIERPMVRFMMNMFFPEENF